ncbi:MFS monosaccharide transporter [Dacryopinax primogenitus]|uniref:MFS monosaccharide transporter n=1 Tax=Dacryopinax primogenitus (strain DJM 731) TaxID=1858805 RepID=M5FSD7_DACPD|nr:MFS monosaccharide transporter [Dacryopinax primogenitus]EJU00326.1 MFS monosaccharide transporter [Dacryopinax primogenitus]
MKNPNPALVGAVPGVYIAGEAAGALFQVFVSDWLGRKRFMMVLCVIVTVGSALQTGAPNFAAFLVGRVIAGFAVGGLIACVVLFNTASSEISPPHARGLVTGISGIGISLGTMVSNWIGLGGAYAPYGQIQWRLPLGLQIPWGIFLFLALLFVLPESPRWLYRHGHEEEARKAFISIHGGSFGSDREAEAEFILMTKVIEAERSQEVDSVREIFARYPKRTIISMASQTMTSLTGVNVIQYYQTILYKALGMTGNNILLLAGVYGTVALIANVLTTWFICDRFGRRPMLLLGLLSVVIVDAYNAIMTDVFATSSNNVAKGFAILGIYLFVTCYYGLLNSTTWLYAPEIVPLPIRSKVTALGAFTHFVVNVGLTEAGPSAFQNIGANYYWVFVGSSAFFLVFGWFYFKETKDLTLEQIAKQFGDDLVPVTEEDIRKLETEENKGDASSAGGSAEKQQAEIEHVENGV